MFEPTGFSAEIFKQRYALTENETWFECCMRVARQIALAEPPDKQLKYQDHFYDVLVNNLFVPGGRILYNSGRPNPNMLNCFALRDDLDSAEGWGLLSYEMIVTSMKHGGCGINFSDVRPQGAEINGQKGTAPGPIELMKLVNANGYSIRAGGARRTALLFGLSIEHPEIIKFIDCKTDNSIDMANISAISHKTTEFIKAIEGNKEWVLSWKGRYKQSIPATFLWDKIVSNAYNFAEPGILNWELMESESNTYYIKNLTITNPCGELPLESYGSCCLGHVVLPRFVVNNELDYSLLADTVRTAVRFLDNVLTVNHYPLPEFKEVGQKNRRIGLGTTGLADMLILLGYKYGSEESLAFIDELYRFISKQAYEASIMLAIEKGAFPNCKPNLHVQSGFIKRMTPKIKALIKEHGIRNATILTQAPTGTVSILSGNCSSGIEPVFAPAYERRYYVGNDRRTELVFHPLFKKMVEENKDTTAFISSHEIDVEQHLKVQATIQKHVDSSVSKTVNLPKEYPLDKLKEVWLKYLPQLKGCTFYREGSRDFGGQEAPLKPIELSKALELIKSAQEHVERSEVDCISGQCSL